MNALQIPEATVAYVDEQLAIALALKANQAATCTKVEVVNLLNDIADTLDMHAALALKADSTYTDEQLLMKANQRTTYTKNEADALLTPKATTSYVDTELANNANVSGMLISLSQKHHCLT